MNTISQTESSMLNQLQTEKDAFDRALEARDDGEDALYIELLRKCITYDTFNRDYHLKLIIALLKIRDYDNARQAASNAVNVFNDDPDFMLEHARVSVHACDWERTIDELNRIIDRFITSDVRVAVQAIIDLMIPLCESGQRQRAIDIINEHWTILSQSLTSPRHLFDALVVLNLHELCLSYLQFLSIKLTETTVDGLNVKNAIKILETAVYNKKNKSGKNIIVSIGQNCLPFTISNRWGLNRFPAIESEMTIFDMGAFPELSSFDTLCNDFSFLFDKDNYIVDSSTHLIDVVKSKALGT